MENYIQPFVHMKIENSTSSHNKIENPFTFEFPKIIF